MRPGRRTPIPRRSNGGKRKLLRVAFATEGVGSVGLAKGSAAAARADIPRSSRVSCEGVGVSVIREVAAGVSGRASVGSDREEAAPSVNRVRAAGKPSEAGEGKPEPAGEGGQGGSWCWLVVVGPASTVCMAGCFACRHVSRRHRRWKTPAGTTAARRCWQSCGRNKLAGR